VIADRRTFAFIPGDHAAYAVRDGEGAVALARAVGSVAVDIETAGLLDEAWDVRAVVIGTADFAHVLDPYLDRAAIRDALEAATELTFHNAPFDVPSLVEAGLMEPRHIAKVTDTLVNARIAAPSERGGRRLGQLATQYLGEGYDRAKRQSEQSWRSVTGMRKAEMFRRSGLFSEAYCMYAGWDVIMTARLRPVLVHAVEQRTTTHPFKTSGDPFRIIDREQTINRQLLGMSVRGIAIDFDVINELQNEMLERGAKADAMLRVEWGIDTDLTREKVKTDAVARLDEWGVFPANYPRLGNGSPSADKRYLSRINHPIVEALAIRATALRFSDDYLEKVVRMSRRGLIHPQVAVAQAVTGRMSYSTPPLQQYPAAMRRMLRFNKPAVSLDWSSIEPVLFANLAGEEAMLAPFEAGGDLYQPVAEAAGVDRKTAKVVLLAQLYGQGVDMLAAALGRSPDDTREVINRILGPYKRVRDVKRVISDIASKFGVVQTWDGRIIPIDGDPRTNNERHFGYKGVNYVVQGGAYSLLAEAMYAMHHAGLDDGLYAAVHDELVVDAAIADEVERIMLTPPPTLIEECGRTPIFRTGRTALGQHWISKE
jgi:DNA polymerase I